MQKCRACGADLPENTRFCGKCGSVQIARTTNAANTRSSTLQPPSWAPDRMYPAQGTAPAWSSNAQASATPPPSPVPGTEDERRRGIPPWSPLSGAALGGGALLSGGQPFSPGAPVVPGTPQIGSVPSVAGSPTPYLNAPVGNPVQGAANASVSQPPQWVGNVPVSHPVQGTGNVPIKHPVHGPQPTPHPPEPPGTQHPHPPHKPHRHRTHHTHHTTASATKVAGGSTVKTILIVVTAVVVVGAGGIAAAAHFLSHPHPLISITSTYTVGNTPAGTSGTILHISGQQFSSNSAITLLLDGHVAPGNPGTRSDSNGSFSTNVTITTAWSVGTHILTARDASNEITKNGVSVTIVQPGQANTPGPDGAPPDDASFTLKVTIHTADPFEGEPFASNPVLIITGHPDPKGGTVCSPDDSGQSFTQNGTTFNAGTPYSEVETATCSGTYKAGQISYIETDTSARSSYQSNGVNVTCVLNNPAVILQLTGAYAGHGTFSGTISFPYVPYTCNPQGYGLYQEAQMGTWTGTIAS